MQKKSNHFIWFLIQTAACAPNMIIVYSRYDIRNAQAINVQWHFREVFLNELPAADFNPQLLAEIPVWLDGSSSPNDSTGMIYGLEMVIPYYVWASECFTLE